MIVIVWLQKPDNTIIIEFQIWLWLKQSDRVFVSLLKNKLEPFMFKFKYKLVSFTWFTMT